VQIQINNYYILTFGPPFILENNNEKIEITRIEWFYDGTDAKNGITNLFVPYSYEISCKLEEVYKSDQTSFVVSDKPRREVFFFKNHEYHKQFRKTDNSNPEGRNVSRGYKNMKCYSYPSYQMPPHSQVFGVDLDILMKHPLNKGERVPLVVKKLIEFIALEGPTTEGIFRVSGSKSKKDELKRLWNRGMRVNTLTQDYSVQNAADLLKEFIRSLPKPLCPDMVFIPIREIARNSPDVQKNLLTSAFKFLSVYNRNIIIDICLLLRSLLKYQTVTLMNEENLCLVWSPNLFSSYFSLEDQRNITLSLIKNLDTNSLL